jgi:SNF2 family DNA or RNA helicase
MRVGCAVRLDGTMNAAARQASIDQFQTDKETCVFRESPELHLKC